MKKICTALAMIGVVTTAHAYKLIPETDYERASRMGLSCTFAAVIVGDIIKARTDYKKTHPNQELGMAAFLKQYGTLPPDIPPPVGRDKAWFNAVAPVVATTIYTTELIDADYKTAFEQIKTMCLLNPSKYYVGSHIAEGGGDRYIEMN